MPDAPITTAVIFDLDGTLVQTRAASWEIFREISDEFGLGLTGPDEYFALFRSNVFASIRRLCRDDEQAEQVKAAFLQRLRDGYSPPMIPGMVQVVRQLAERCTLAVMSSNAMHALRRVLVGHDVAVCFAHVFGGDVAPDKREAIRHFMADTCSGYGRRCEVNYDETATPAQLERATTVLVTDTAGDVRDAVAEGLRVVGVAWGMHPVDELTAAGAEFVALWPQEVAAHLLAGAPAPAPGPLSGACRLPGTEPAAGPRVECECDCSSGGAAASTPSTAPTLEAARAAGGTRRRRRRRSVASVLGPEPAVPVAGEVSAELRAAVARCCRPA